MRSAHGCGRNWILPQLRQGAMRGVPARGPRSALLRGLPCEVGDRAGDGAARAARSASPGAALALGFIPGLGAVYNGEYLKALIHVIIFGGLIAAQSHHDMPGGYHAFLGIALFAFYCYMPVEAYRTAKARELGEPAPPDLIEGEGRKPIGAIILISLGIFFLLENFGWLEWDWFDKVWPVALIGLGVWLLRDRMKMNG